MGRVSGDRDEPEREGSDQAGELWHGDEVRGVADGQVQLWATTRPGPRVDDDEDARWADWSAATFTPLEQVDAQLARTLAGVLVDQFLEHGGLSTHRRDEAVASLRLRRGVTPGGRLILGADLPLGAGHPEFEWDGSPAGAAEIARSMGGTAGENISSERDIVGPTGWEPEDGDAS